MERQRFRSWQAERAEKRSRARLDKMMAAATFLSAVATVFMGFIALMQYKTMQIQLTAPDNNRVIEVVAGNMIRFCRALTEYPLEIERPKRNGDNFVERYYDGERDLSEFRRKLNDIYLDFVDSFRLTYVWIDASKHDLGPLDFVESTTFLIGDVAPTMRTIEFARALELSRYQCAIQLTNLTDSLLGKPIQYKGSSLYDMNAIYKDGLCPKDYQKLCKSWPRFEGTAVSD